MNRLLAAIGSTQPQRCILLFDETLLNVTNIAMGLHLLRIVLDSVKGKCLVVAIGMLLVCSHIATTKSIKFDHIFRLDVFFYPFSHTLVKFLFCVFFFQWNAAKTTLQHTPHEFNALPCYFAMIFGGGEHSEIWISFLGHLIEDVLHCRLFVCKIGAPRHQGA